MSQQQNDDQSQGLHPAWKELLEAVPESLHGVIKPHLENQSKNFEQKLQDVRGEYSNYDPYKDIVSEGTDPEYIKGALHLAQQIRENPDAVIEQANKAFGLNWKQPGSNDNDNDDNDFDTDFDGVDIQKHPFVQQMAQQLSQLQEGFTSREQAEQNAQAQADFEQQLEDLKETEGEFNPLFVTALVSQGVDPKDAVNQYKSLLEGEVAKVTNPEQAKKEPPVVMGGSGNVGSGVPSNEVDFAKMKDGEVMDLVNNILQQQENET